MHINLEAAENNAIEAYSDHEIQVNSIVYKQSLILSQSEIITDLAIKSIADINDTYLELLLQLKPEVIIIGHGEMGKLLPISIMSELSQQRIGVECMSIGAACRTYNVLLSEFRAVVGGFIFS